MLHMLLGCSILQKTLSKFPLLSGQLHLLVDGAVVSWHAHPAAQTIDILWGDAQNL